MSYITQTVDKFFVKLDKMQGELARFKRDLDDRSGKIPTLLENFEQKVFLTGGKKFAGKNAVERAVQKSLDTIREGVEIWRNKIEADRKGQAFIKKNEKYLVVMVFGSVKAGKSSLGNFFAGKKFINAPFDNHYKKIPKPIFDTEESGRDTGDIEKDSHGDTWFQEGVIDTTGAIQYFTLSGLRWIDSPGTGAVGKEGDTKDMTALVEEYFPYADMCIFLMNSSEPGLQDDMVYMQKLNREGQEALIVITKSDDVEEDEDDDGNLTSVLVPKTPATRKLQEDDICARVKKKYPKIDANKFRAISTSTALANEAVDEQDDAKFRDSGIDKLMKILGDKVSDNVIERKQRNPRRLLNNFVDSVVDDLKDFDTTLNEINDKAEEYKSSMDARTKSIVASVRTEVETEVRERAKKWNDDVKHGAQIDNYAINAEVSKILQQTLNQEINRQMQHIIEDFQNTVTKTVQANISAAALEKKTIKTSHTYTESYVVEREPEGFIENICGFFGKKYYRTEYMTHTKEQTIDAGTNLDEFLNSLMPKVEDYAKKETDTALAELRSKYFVEQENFSKSMRGEIDKLRAELLRLKF